MRVIELRDGPCLVLEAITKLKVGRELRWQDLDGDGAIEAGVARLVDLAHPARAKGRLDLVRAKAPAGF